MQGLPKTSSTAPPYSISTTHLKRSGGLSMQPPSLTAPAYVLLVLLNFAENPVNASAAQILIVRSSAYIIGWVNTPLIMIALTDKLNRFDQYFQFMTARNWAIVLQVFVFLAISALIAERHSTATDFRFVSLIAVITIMGYQGFYRSCRAKYPRASRHYDCRHRPRGSTGAGFITPVFISRLYGRLTGADVGVLHRHQVQTVRRCRRPACRSRAASAAAIPSASILPDPTEFPTCQRKFQI